MSRGPRAVAVAVVVGALATALDAAAAPAVDIDDLPPLPESSDAPSSAAAVMSATAVEEDVVVGAAKREQTLGNVASAVTVISGDRLRRFGYRTLAEALRGVAGLFISDDHMTSRLGIRGLQILGDFNTRILVLVDGATVNEPWNQFAGLDWDSPVTIDEIERVEVIRGPVSSVYGTNAFFGIINIVTRGAAGGARNWGRVSASSFKATSAAAGFTTGTVNRQLRGSVAALYRAGEDVPLAELGRTDLPDGMIGWHASLVGSYQGAFAQIRAYRRVRELTYAPYGTPIGNPANRNYDNQVLAEGGYTRAIGKALTVTARAYLQRYRFADALQYDDPGPFEDYGDSTWYGGEIRGRYAVLADDKLGVTAGAEATFEKTRSRSFYTGDEAGGANIPVDFDLQGLYAEVDSRPVPWLAITGGLRADRNSLLEDRVSPRAAVFLSHGNDYGAKFLYAQGFRNPSAYEGFFADNISFKANPDIGAETITSLESVVWGRPVPGLSVRLSGFRWQARKLIEQQDDGSGLLEFQNVGSRTSTGVEVEATYRTGSGWFAYGGGAVAQVTVPDSTEDAINAPTFTGAAGISTPKLRDRVHVSTELLLMGSSMTREGAQTGAWAGWNAAIYVPDLRGLDLTIGARNLLGTRQPVVAPEDYDRPQADGTVKVVPIVPGEGRELYARVGYTF
ncbi:MAG: TonB-dependent receptor [Deltaproteobacteria bacterium]|nr:TonB-dependent receptor [Deltaproteobacteria bacterium]